MWKTWLSGLMIATMIAPTAALAEAPSKGAVDPGYALLAPLYESEGGFAFSPLSLRLAVQMAMLGAKGETAAQLVRVFGEEALSLEAVRTLGALKFANAAIVSPSVALRAEYESALAKQYDAALMPMRDDIVPQVNEWVKDKTDGMIEEILSEPPNPNTMLILLNALTFQADWQRKFDPILTRDAPFYAPTGEISVPFMHDTFDMEYASSESAQAIKLPYKGDQLEMVLILPNEGAMGDVIAQLSGDGLDAMGLFVVQPDVKLALPKMQLDSTLVLNDALKAIGIADVFGERADFTGISEASDLCIDEVRQKVHIDVDEDGTKAAAATSISIMNKGMTLNAIRMTFDRPFVALIRDVQTGMLAFAAVVEQP